MALIGLADAKKYILRNNQVGHVMHTMFFLFLAKSPKPYEEQVISRLNHHD
jgi:superoxide dismutase